jgi:aminoglycoside N3'-acetyltransferase
MNILQNGIDSDNESHQSMDRIYTPENTEISSEMGIVAKHILLRKESFIGYHPENAFASLGPEAEAIIQSQSPWNVYAPYDRIMTYDKAFILLLGVDLCKATPIHYAEYVSGRIPFIRWYCDENHVIRPMRVGGCSDGFDSCSSVVSHLNQCKPGNSGWINIYPFKDFIHELVQIFRQNHEITRCSDPECPRCRDILKGGPFYSFKRYGE